MAADRGGDWLELERQADRMMEPIVAKAHAAMLASLPVPLPDDDDFEKFLRDLTAKSSSVRCCQKAV